MLGGPQGLLGNAGEEVAELLERWALLTEQTHFATWAKWFFVETFLFQMQHREPTGSKVGNYFLHGYNKS